MPSSASLSSVGIATAMPLSSASHITPYPPSFVCQNTTCQHTDGKTQRPPGSCSYWHWGASKLQWRSANTWRLPCLAPRTETQAHACPLPSICVPHSPVSSPSFQARASQDDASRKESFCQPSFKIRTECHGQTSPVLPKSVPHKGLSCQTASISSPKMKI